MKFRMFISVLLLALASAGPALAAEQRTLTLTVEN